MNWIIESLASMVLLVLTQILVKVNSRAGVPPAVINFATYVLVLAVFLFAGVGMEINAEPPIYFLIFAAGIFTFLGNAASVRGFTRSPNPGYSTAINKSYAAVTVVASIFLFGGELLWRRLVGVALILASQLLIVGRKPGQARDDSHWVAYSFGAFFSYAILSLLVKYVTSGMGVYQLTFLFWSILLAVALFYAQIVWQKIPLANYRKQAGLLALTGILSGFANIFLWNAFIHAPNMGYVNAINVASVAILALLAVKLFGDELTRQKSLGIAGVIAGLLLIVLT